jgi:hypothetical protein
MVLFRPPHADIEIARSKQPTRRIEIFLTSRGLTNEKKREGERCAMGSMRHEIGHHLR